MSARLDELNASLRAELDRPLRIGMGIHCGPTIVGEMGYGNAAAITAIGDAVNIASRLESLTKNFACELVVSEQTVSRAGLDLSAFPWCLPIVPHLRLRHCGRSATAYGRRRPS
jgi:adenylate cyclase